ncbi:hypothetical protein F4810DRAFT_144890 [Camillea tinctor]|nr:hypothetical protein F4810DRAFT_144890 [Camillea tinctor]
MGERITAADLALLKSQVHVRTSVDPETKATYHSIDVQKHSCRITIHVTKPSLGDPLHPNYSTDPEATAYVEVDHSERGDRDSDSDCKCSHFALLPRNLFKVWRQVAETLRYQPEQPELWTAFTDSDTSFETAEALSTAALVAKFALRLEWPECCNKLAYKHGAIERTWSALGKDDEEEPFDWYHLPDWAQDIAEEWRAMLDADSDIGDPLV